MRDITKDLLHWSVTTSGSTPSGAPEVDLDLKSYSDIHHFSIWITLMRSLTLPKSESSRWTGEDREDRKKKKPCVFFDLFIFYQRPSTGPDSQPPSLILALDHRTAKTVSPGSFRSTLKLLLEIIDLSSLLFTPLLVLIKSLPSTLLRLLIGY